MGSCSDTDIDSCIVLKWRRLFNLDVFRNLLKNEIIAGYAFP